MKQILLLIFTCCMALAVHAQEVPYSKYLQFSKKEFKDNHFKYPKKKLKKSSGKIEPGQ